MEDLIGSAVGGGVLGLFGTAINRVMGIWERREAREDTRISNAHELRLIEENRESSRQETEAELVRIQTEGSYAGLAESLRHDASLSNVSPWVNNVRALVRPTLTGLSLTAMIAMAFFMSEDLQVTVTEAVVFVATTAGVWWFGDRSERRSLFSS